MESNNELLEKARALVERKRKIIRAGVELLLKTGGAYSEEDSKIAEELGEESHRIAVERERLLRQAWEMLDPGALLILEAGYFDAIKDEVEKSRKQIDEVFGPARE